MDGGTWFSFGHNRTSLPIAEGCGGVLVLRLCRVLRYVKIMYKPKDYSSTINDNVSQAKTSLLQY